VRLASQVYGEGGDRPPLLIAHGLFGSARNWGVIAKRLSETRRVVVVDMRNHGDSPWSETHDYPAMAEDLAEAIDGRWDVIGHSMGGKAAMVLALTHPGKVNRLIIADIAPVAYGHTQAHLVDAMMGLDLSGIASRGDADRALAASLEDAGVRAFLLQSLDLRERRWRLNLETLGREMPKILSFPETGGRFDGPTLFLSGGTSTYVLPEHRDRIRALFPSARFAKIPGAGHWLHAEKPREFEAAVAAFLA
jgi:pimeloyl-ACP methyl ester carboxylesterase